jgi:hypothetical protein
MTWYSYALYAQSFSGADRGAEHNLMVAKDRERLAVSKQTTHRFHMQKFNPEKNKRGRGYRSSIV